MGILIVDDSGATRDSLRALLEAKGYRDVLSAASGQEALRLLQVAPPGPGARGPQAESPAGSVPAVDVILMDVEMPGMDGIEACRRLKSAPHLRDVPVLIVTGLPDEHILEAAFEAGAADYITKPVYGPELLARLRSATNLKHEIDTLKTRELELVKVTEQLRLLNDELQRLAVLDELTGVANRRFFNLMLSQEWGRAAREVHPLSLVMVDIDYFKHFNDHYGHQRGDECLREVARALSTVTKRYGDQVARYGGEEFAILMPHTGLAGASAIADRLRQKVEEMGLEHAASPVADHVTVSLGVAVGIPGRRSTAETLLAAADSALYEAKRQGRNRVKVFGGTLDDVQPPGRLDVTHAAAGARR